VETVGGNQTLKENRNWGRNGVNQFWIKLSVGLFPSPHILTTVSMTD
jgi:hypothetical protein